MEVEHLLSSAKNELTAIENRNKAFESKLGTANREISSIQEGTNKVLTDITLKKEIYESELKKLTDESAELSRGINSANIEIESLMETQTTLENQLSTVKQEMMGLAA